MLYLRRRSNDIGAFKCTIGIYPEPPTRVIPLAGARFRQQCLKYRSPVEALGRARAELVEARAQLRHEALDLAAEALRLAHDALGEITGRVHPDDLLGRIFSSFCIGK